MEGLPGLRCRPAMFVGEQHGTPKPSAGCDRDLTCAIRAAAPMVDGRRVRAVAVVAAASLRIAQFAEELVNQQMPGAQMPIALFVAPLVGMQNAFRVPQDLERDRLTLQVEK